MIKMEIQTTLPREMFKELAMRAATEKGFNCYSKPALLPDEEGDGFNVFYFKWKGRTIAITVKSKDNESNDL